MSHVAPAAIGCRAPVSTCKQGSIVVGILASSHTTITSTPLEATIDITSCNEGTTIVASNATSTTIAIIE
jgi:S-adenosylmethionine/arginine decarboxylase-like enzyme